MGTSDVIGTSEMAELLDWDARPLRFSELKAMAKSPAHFLQARRAGWEPTREMRIGTIVHRMRLGGPPLLIWDGIRRGKAWEEFEAAHQGEEIFTRSEVEEAESVARAVLADPIASRVLDGCTFEVPLAWEAYGFKCATQGVDFLRRGVLYGDLKTTRDAKPSTFDRQAWSLHYHAQLAWYGDAIRQTAGVEPGEAFVVTVETAKPHPVVVRRLTERALLEGQKCLTLWLERLRVCLDAGDWPGYAQDVVELDAPAWLAVDEDEDAGDAEAAE